MDPDYFTGIGVTYTKVLDGVNIGVGIATTSMRNGGKILQKDLQSFHLSEQFQYPQHILWDRHSQKLLVENQIQY